MIINKHINYIVHMDKHISEVRHAEKRDGKLYIYTVWKKKIAPPPLPPPPKLKPCKIACQSGQDCGNCLALCQSNQGSV